MQTWRFRITKFWKPENSCVSFFLCMCRESNLTLKGLVEAVLQKFTAIQHEPIWKGDRPEMIRGDSNLRVYRIYPVGLTQREALYSWSFKSDEGFKEIVRQHPCSNFEVIFVWALNRLASFSILRALLLASWFCREPTFSKLPLRVSMTNPKPKYKSHLYWFTVSFSSNSWLVHFVTNLWTKWISLEQHE